MTDECAAGHFFLGGLEDHADAAVELALVVNGLEHLGDAQHHRGVDVVAAGVRHAVDDRGVFEPGLLEDRQGVDVGAQGQRDRAGSDVDEGTGFLQRDGLQAGSPQLGEDALGGLVFHERKFGVGVQFAAEVHQLAKKRGHPGLDRGNLLVLIDTHAHKNDNTGWGLQHPALRANVAVLRVGASRVAAFASRLALPVPRKTDWTPAWPGSSSLRLRAVLRGRP